MSATDDTNTALRGSGSNDLLGLLPERVEIALADLLEQQFKLGALTARTPRPSKAQCTPAADAIQAACDAIKAAIREALATERERWTEAVMAELDSNGQAQAIVAYATRA